MYLETNQNKTWPDSAPDSLLFYVFESSVKQNYIINMHIGYERGVMRRLTECLQNHPEKV